jgi:hypothetical protein
MAGYNFLNGAFQFVAFPHIVEHFDLRRVFIIGIASPLSRRSLGATNGLAQMIILIQQTVALAAVALVFPFVKNQRPRRKLYLCRTDHMVCAGLCIAAQLPKNTWKPSEK